MGVHKLVDKGYIIQKKILNSSDYSSTKINKAQTRQKFTNTPLSCGCPLIAKPVQLQQLDPKRKFTSECHWNQNGKDLTSPLQ